MALCDENMASLRRCFAGGALLLVSLLETHAIVLTAPAQGCLIKAEGSDAVTAVKPAQDGGRQPAEFTDQYIPLSDCAGVRIIRGIALVYFGLGDIETRRKQVVRAGELIEVPKDMTSAAPDDRWTKFVTAFTRLLRPHEVEAKATSRGVQDDAAAIFPTGRILPLRSAMTIDPTSVGVTEIDDFEISRRGGTRAAVLSLEHVAGTLRIPAGVLSPGLDYLWSAHIHGAAVEGTFYVLSRSEAAAIEEADPSRTAHGTDTVSTLDRALFLQSRGLEFDSIQIIRQLTAEGKR